MSKYFVPPSRMSAVSSRVVSNPEIYKKVTPLARKLGFEWANNGLRHSFISYRIALVKS